MSVPAWLGRALLADEDFMERLTQGIHQHFWGGDQARVEGDAPHEHVCEVTHVDLEDLRTQLEERIDDLQRELEDKIESLRDDLEV